MPIVVIFGCLPVPSTTLQTPQRQEMSFSSVSLAPSTGSDEGPLEEMFSNMEEAERNAVLVSFPHL